MTLLLLFFETKRILKKVMFKYFFLVHHRYVFCHHFPSENGQILATPEILLFFTSLGALVDVTKFQEHPLINYCVIFEHHNMRLLNHNAYKYNPTLSIHRGGPMRL